MRRRSSASIVANPVLVGAVTTLVVIVAVFLAYNANNGLPFVPTRQLNVYVANGANLVKGNEVREGGYRIGVVSDMIPVKLPDGRIGARLQLKLDQKSGPVPIDTRVIIRPRSALGLKYVEIDKGTSRKDFPDGATLPAAQASYPVELDQVYSMFDAKTRRASSNDLIGFGNTFAGRGADLNLFIGYAPRLFGLLAPVMSNLGDSRTNLPGFFRALDRTVSTIAPVAKIQARIFTTMADTFHAISEDPQALKDTISKSPPTEQVSIDAFQIQRPFLRDTVAFSRDLAAAAGDLRPALPVINSALEVGTPIVRRSAQLNTKLQGALNALYDLASAPETNAALRGLTATVTTLQPQLRFLGPYVTVCNSWNFFWTLAAEHQTAPTAAGQAQRALLNSPNHQTNNVGAMGATQPAAGLGQHPNDGAPEYLHGNYYGHAMMPDGTADCEAGQQGYVHGAAPFLTDAQAGQPNAKDYSQVVLDPGHIDYKSGPSYKLLDRNGRGVGLNPDTLPKGETFTVEPGGIGVKVIRP
jgi:ABC-type transporter Mla subunit MlaD